MRLYDCMRALEGKQLCLRNHSIRQIQCRSYKKPQTLKKTQKIKPKILKSKATPTFIYDFTSTPCKNFKLNMYDCIREQNQTSKKQCLTAFKSRESACKTLITNILKIHDFTYASCKNTGLLLYDCMKAEDGEEKQ